MNFYVDFEATQFSHCVLSIGCVSETGTTFETLVNSEGNEGVTEFITKLTGLTPEMVANAPTPDQAFNLFREFVEEESGDEDAKFFCYGDSDKVFLQKTLRFMKDETAMEFVCHVKDSLVNYQKNVSTYFHSPNNVSLKKLYNFIQQENEKQKHDALEDAKMLQLVHEKLMDVCAPTDLAQVEAMPAVQERHFPEPKKAPELFTSWNGQDKWKVNTEANETSFKVKCVDLFSPGRVKYFKNTYIAALWVLKYFTRGMTPKKESHVQTVKNLILAAIQSNQPYYGMAWSVKE